MKTVPLALVGAEQQGKGGLRFGLGQKVAQAPGEKRDGTAATVLEYQEVAIGSGGYGLKAQQAHCGIRDKLVPRRPCAFACPAELEGAGHGLDAHSLIIGPELQTALHRARR